MEDLWKWIESNADALLVVIGATGLIGAAGWKLYTHRKVVPSPSPTPTIQQNHTGPGDNVAGDKIAGDKVAGDKVAGNKVTRHG